MHLQTGRVPRVGFARSSSEPLPGTDPPSPLLSLPFPRGLKHGFFTSSLGRYELNPRGKILALSHSEGQVGMIETKAVKTLFPLRLLFSLRGVSQYRPEMFADPSEHVCLTYLLIQKALFKTVFNLRPQGYFREKRHFPDCSEEC